MKTIRWTGLAALLAANVVRADADPATPTLVTLHRQNAPAAEVITEIAKQAGFTVPPPGTPDAWKKLITVDVDARPFWDTLLDACRQTGYDPLQQPPHVNGDGATLNVFNYGPAASGRTAAVGPLAATFLRIRHGVKFATASQRSDDAAISVQLCWEPKLKVLFCERVPTPDEAVDDAGHSLLLPAPVGDDTSGRVYENLAYSNQTQLHTDLMIPLRVPPDAGRRIARLRGRLRVFTGVPASVDVPDVAKIKSKTVVELGKGNPVTLKDVSIGADAVNMRLCIERRPGESTPAWQQRQMLLQAGLYFLTDANGNNWSRPDGYNGTGWGATEFYVRLEAQRQPNIKSVPAKLTLTGYASAVPVELPYDLSDLPLP